MKTPQESKKYAFTIKAGSKRAESVTAQKRFLISQLLTVKKMKKAIIFYNQKKNMAALEKHLNKLDMKTILLDKNTSKADYTKLKKDFKSKDSFIILCPDVSVKHLKEIQKDIPLAIHFDFPKSLSSYSSRCHFIVLAESYFLISPEDKADVEKILANENLHIRLGRLKGHRNAQIDIDFSKEAVAIKEKKETAIYAKESEKKVEQPKKSRKKTKGLEQEESKQNAQNSDSTNENESKTKDQKQTHRTRRKKENTENGERLPAKRTRLRKTSVITGAQHEKNTPIEAEIEEDSGIYLDIEIRQIPKPKIKRNPQGRVIGMGEHTPNFMLKEIIFKNSTLHEEEE